MTDNWEEDQADLDRIAQWEIKDKADLRALLHYVKERWSYKDAGSWDDSGDRLELHTFGWSVNESLIDAMTRNWFFWSMLWESSRRGGHYVLDLTRLS